MVDFDAENYDLLISFPDQSESFVLGFEAGQVYNRMQLGEQEIELTAHTANVEVFSRLAMAMKYELKFDAIPIPDSVDGGYFVEWISVRFVPGSAKPALSLVEESNDV